MVVRLWQRPSVVVVGAAALWLGVFVVSGRLRLEPLDTKVAKREPAPTVVNVGRPKPTLPKLELVGRVVDATGYLVVGAEVGLRGAASVRTDASGQFSLPVDKPASGSGAVDLEVRANGHRQATVRASLQSPDPVVVRLSPVAPWDAKVAALAPFSDELLGEGFVRNAEGKPATAAFVTVAGSGVWASTDEIGRYVLPLPAGEFELVVHQPIAGGDGRGGAARSARVRPEREKGVVPLPELVAEPGAMLRGKIADASGAPVTGVPVEVRGNGITRILESGMSGVFRLAGLLPGQYEVRALPFRGALGTTHTVELGEDGAECALAMTPAAERRLRVLDETGQALPRVHVAATFAGSRSGVAQADGEGFVSVRAAKDGGGWEVRTNERFDVLPLRRADGETLVVAAP